MRQQASFVGNSAIHSRTYSDPATHIDYVITTREIYALKKAAEKAGDMDMLAWLNGAPPKYAPAANHIPDHISDQRYIADGDIFNHSDNPNQYRSVPPPYQLVDTFRLPDSLSQVPMSGSQALAAESNKVDPFANRQQRPRRNTYGEGSYTITTREVYAARKKAAAEAAPMAHHPSRRTVPDAAGYVRLAQAEEDDLSNEDDSDHEHRSVNAYWSWLSSLVGCA